MAEAAKKKSAGTYESPLLTYARGRFVRDPVVADRKDGSGNKSVLGTIRVIENITDHNGDDRSFEHYIDVAIFRPEIANAIAAASPKENDLIEILGTRTDGTRDFESRDGGTKTVNFRKVTVGDRSSDHFAKLL